MSNPLSMKKHWKRMDQSSFTIKNIQMLVEISPGIVSNTFSEWNGKHHNLMQQNDFLLPSIRTVHHGSESLSYLGPNMWSSISIELKNGSSLINHAKLWKPVYFPCRLCKTYINGVGFLQVLHFLWFFWYLFCYMCAS